MKHGTSAGYVKNPVLLLLLTVLLGTMLGSLFYTFCPDSEFWRQAMFRQGMGTAASAFSFGNLLFHIAGVSLIWLMLAMLSGMSLAGVPLSVGLLLLRGVALGAVLGEVYLVQGVTALLTVSVFVMPYALVSTFLFLLGIREAMRFSSGMFRLVCKGREEKLSLRLYAFRFLILALFLSAAGLLQCLLLRCGYPAYLEFMVGK